MRFDNNMDFQKQTISEAQTSPLLLVSEGNNCLFFTERNSVFTSENKIASNDICLFLLAYVHYFCIPFSILILNVFDGYGKNVQGIYNEKMSIHNFGNSSSLENKDYISILSFLMEEQVGVSITSDINYEKPCCYS